MPSIFSRIIAGEIPCYKIAENDHCLAFLDVNPLVEGHVLVVPKIEEDFIFDLDEELFIELQLFAKKVAQHLKEHIACKRVGVAVIGLEVPHAHIHLIPINQMDDMNFSRKKLSLNTDQLTDIARKLNMGFI